MRAAAVEAIIKQQQQQQQRQGTSKGLYPLGGDHRMMSYNTLRAGFILIKCGWID